jgi:hypothetical protein
MGLMQGEFYMSDLDKFKDEMMIGAFGITKGEAIAKRICVKCKEPADPKIRSEAGRREYHISGLCEECWDNMFKEEQ